MPTETKNSTANASRKRQRLGRGALAEIALRQHHAGEEGAEREGHAEHFGRGVGDAERERVARPAEQLA